MNIDAHGKEYIYITVITETGFAGATHTNTIPFYKAVWDSMSVQEREEEITQIGLENISIGGFVSTEDGEYVKGVDE